MNVMAWRVEILPAAQRAIQKLASADAMRITAFIDRRLSGAADPFGFGKALTGRLKGRWRYRVGDFRIIAKIERDRLVILVVAVAHRSAVYR